ncbi:PREDICTED: ACD11 homolog protein [Tarenaya hassleriana]|uniref:ACD11 homolog protein n=1 Tax=Tarenaya hassleriana TaxID=28532 RepID=UPI0008FD8947|nr:PREDICTED: ACD11 homolog protein [Tarenaya hassleriana]
MEQGLMFATVAIPNISHAFYLFKSLSLSLSFPRTPKQSRSYLTGKNNLGVELLNFLEPSRSENFPPDSTALAKLYREEELKAMEEEDEEGMFEDAVSNVARARTRLSVITEAFEDLAGILNSRRKVRRMGCGASEEEEMGLRLDAFCSACAHVSVLFECLGLAFKFAEMEYVSKVRNLIEASKTFNTLQDILDLDVENDTVKTPGSNSRNLRRVRQGLDLIRAIFEQFLTTDGYSLKDAATTAYTEVCAPFHTWAVRTAVYAGMYTLPTREQLLVRLNETDRSVEKNMRRYIEASRPIIAYIDKLYIVRNITLDW